MTRMQRGSRVNGMQRVITNPAVSRVRMHGLQRKAGPDTNNADTSWIENDSGINDSLDEHAEVPI